MATETIIEGWGGLVVEGDSGLGIKANTAA